jgi:hypothetical protein
MFASLSKHIKIAIVVGLLAGSSYSASAHEGCTPVTQGDWTFHYGDEHDNDCDGGAGKDSIYGYAAGDTVLNGGTGRDKIRGATGADTLKDALGNGDVDKTCDGDQVDTIDLVDGDGADTEYDLVEPFEDNLFLNSGDDRVDYSAAQGCPI